MYRRNALKTLGALGLLALAPRSVATAAEASAGVARTAETFDYAWLKGRARALSAAPYQKPESRIPPQVKALDWDGYQSISFREDHTLWAKENARFRARFFHLGLYFHDTVRMHEVVDGRARLIAYDKAMFDYGKSGLAGAELPPDLGFAGFRILHHTDPKRDILAFLGASYFRAVGAEKQYGISARGLAIDCGMDRPEEFPMFTDFWLERPARRSEKLAIYALLDSPSTTGAYRFEVTPAPTLVMDVDAALYPRKPIERLGIAPLTSMYLHGENDRRVFNDWRPEIHDSDGLALWNGAGERIWRPLVNPEHLRLNSYFDENPRGFGLLQRDRDFGHYQDDGAYYDRRPSLWVEPKGRWGKGSVQLVEIPTIDETFDNIVAFWNPERKSSPGEELLYSYRLHWGAQMPFKPALAEVVATHTGIGGVVGRKRTYYSWRFVVDFAGGGLAGLGDKLKVEPVITASRGEIEITSARPQHAIKGYRAMFDFKPTDDSTEPVNLRLYLRAGERILTETWLYQWTPPPPDRRTL